MPDQSLQPAPSDKVCLKAPEKVRGYLRNVLSVTQKAFLKDINRLSKIKPSEPTLSRFLQGKGIEYDNAKHFLSNLYKSKWKDAQWDIWLELATDDDIPTSPSTESSIVPDDPYKAEDSQIRYTKYTNQFKEFIEVRRVGFVGRQYIFDDISQRQRSMPSGYISIVGNPGDGKSAIAVNYLQRNPEDNIFHFNIRRTGQNTVAGYLESICNQLDNKFGLGMQLDDPANWTNGVLFNEILERVGHRLRPTLNKLVMVVDALDEVEAMSTGPGSPNPLYLPETLPKNVYCLLTRRKTFELGGLHISDSSRAIDLTAAEYKQAIEADVTLYVQLYLGHEDKGLALYNRLRELGKTPEDFTQLMVTKSRGNFMYLTLVIPAIVKGLYKNLDDLSKLPNDLEEYYEQHWALLDMPNKPFRRYVLRVFLDTQNAIPIDQVRKYLKSYDNSVKEEDINQALVGWWQFLQESLYFGIKKYQIYHESFREFLVQKTRNDGKDVRQMQFDHFENI